jgi:glucuronate isomerase
MWTGWRRWLGSTPATTPVSHRARLNRYGTHPNFQLVVFTLDETVFSREIGPLAGFYPSVCFPTASSP